ncbi:MAG: DUF554 domain-containing protein [Oscillospiraceae bacterium]|nr:DUF554 domain-containing protein [Oscillospiraceae bacterium]
MLGTIVNFFAVIVGSFIGLFLKGRLKERYIDIITTGIGLATLFIGISSCLKNLLDKEANPILFILSLVIGGFIGELLDLSSKFKRFGDFVQSKFSKKETGFSQSFIASSLLFCVGTMSILGSIQSGIKHDHSILFAKSILDGVSSIIFSASLGIGVILSAFVVLFYQGLLTVFSGFISPFITNDMLREISIVGGILVFAIGLNILKITKIKIENFLPAIFIPVIYYLPFVQNIINIFHR